jgi:hypothetical protein
MADTASAAMDMADTTAAVAAEPIADRAEGSTDAQIAKDASAITAARGNVILAARQAVDCLNHLADLPTGDRRQALT